MKRGEIELGAISPSIADQLAAHGARQAKFGVNVEMLDRLAKAATLLHLHSCMTDDECNKARRRIMKKIIPEDIGS